MKKMPRYKRWYWRVRARLHRCDPNNKDCAAYNYYLDPKNLVPAEGAKGRKYRGGKSL